MSVFVIDNSVVSGWPLQNQATAYSDAVATLLQTRRAVAPLLLRLEYTNVLRTACKRQKIVAEQAYEMLAMLGELPIDVDTSVCPAAQLLDLTLRYDLNAYDAVYLDLGLRKGASIATQDAGLANAARAAGLGVVTP